jgi:DNA-binding CsgD family transcriptional regulator
MEPTYPSPDGFGRSLGRHMADISDAALKAKSLDDYGADLLTIFNRVFGHDGGAIQTAVPGQPWDAATVNCNGKLLASRLWHYLSEYRPEELMMQVAGTYQDDEVWSPARRERLAVYEEVIRPAGIRRFMGLGLVRDNWLLGVTVTRTGAVGATFDHHERDALQMMFSVAAAGARAVQSTRPGDEATAATPAWRDHLGLSSAETQIAGYVVRGMQNAEIGALLGLSRNTVRNTLSRVFTKLGVSTRAELVYVLLQPPATMPPCPMQASVLRALRGESSAVTR